MFSSARLIHMALRHFHVDCFLQAQGIIASIGNKANVHHPAMGPEASICVNRTSIPHCSQCAQHRATHA